MQNKDAIDIVAYSSFFHLRMFLMDCRLSETLIKW